MLSSLRNVQCIRLPHPILHGVGEMYIFFIDFFRWVGCRVPLIIGLFFSTCPQGRQEKYQENFNKS